MALDANARATMQKFHCKLAENIDVKEILPYMKDVIDECYIDQIYKQRTSFGQVEKLLTFISRGGSASFTYFMKALDLRYPHFALAIKQELKARGSSSPALRMRKISGQALQDKLLQEQKQRRNSSNLVMPRYIIKKDAACRQLENDIIRKYRLHLHGMNTNRILSLCDSLKDKYHTDLINAEKTPFQRAEKFLDMLVKLGPQALEEFINALNNVDPELGSPILDELNSHRLLILSA